mgnify:CR=1 FL=1
MGFSSRLSFPVATALSCSSYDSTVREGPVQTILKFFRQSMGEWRVYEVEVVGVQFRGGDVVVVVVVQELVCEMGLVITLMLGIKLNGVA